ncbi:unnamed protein product [Rhizophagus irregularis]|uniref:Reverse transcriptase domain-containing protein n=1 Tax=Rhizophagus irregularis TaxID=588596 RepID=A0A915YZI3_9GLOM|nr:unnamed protein product [Rhizophagus irregularis]CAB5356470.1 unnamed protein product [Rhizophagus irregularis]
MIKKLPTQLQRLIRDAFNLVLTTGHIPSKWKPSTIIPIPKPEKFNYNMANGPSTSTPIQIINNLIEDAKTNNKQLWIMFQDISKAFDSISTTGLKIALQRLSLPNRLIDLVIRIFTNRNAQILTAFGPTPSFTASDGVD